MTFFRRYANWPDGVALREFSQGQVGPELENDIGVEVAGKPSADDLRRWLRRATRALGEHEVPEAVARDRAIIGVEIPDGEQKAQAAWKKLRDGDSPTWEELAREQVCEQPVNKFINFELGLGLKCS